MGCAESPEPEFYTQDEWAAITSHARKSAVRGGVIAGSAGLLASLIWWGVLQQPATTTAPVAVLACLLPFPFEFMAHRRWHRGLPDEFRAKADRISKRRAWLLAIPVVMLILSLPLWFRPPGWVTLSILASLVVMTFLAVRVNRAVFTGR